MTAQTPQHVYMRELSILIETEIERLMEVLSNGHLENYAEYKYLAGKIAGLRLAYEYLVEADQICAEKYR
jgi:hypothetical protein